MPGTAACLLLPLLMFMLLLAGCADSAVAPSIFSTPTPVIEPTPTPGDDIPLSFEIVAINYTGIPEEQGLPAVVTRYYPDTNNEEVRAVVEKGAWLAVVTTTEEALRLQPFLAPEQYELLTGLDFEEHTALVFFGGMATRNYNVYIQRIAVTQEGVLSVHAIHRFAAMATADQSYPSLIARIRRADMPVALSAGMPLSLSVTAGPPIP